MTEAQILKLSVERERNSTLLRAAIRRVDTREISRIQERQREITSAIFAAGGKEKHADTLRVLYAVRRKFMAEYLDKMAEDDQKMADSARETPFPQTAEDGE